MTEATPRQSAQATATKGRRTPRTAMTVLLLVIAVIIAAGFAFRKPLIDAGRQFFYKSWTSSQASPMALDPNYSEEEKLMYSLSHVGGKAAVEAVEQIANSGDRRFIPVLIEMLRAGEGSRPLVGAGPHRHVYALEKLAGMSGNDTVRQRDSASSISAPWTRWAGKQKIELLPGFTGWKGKMLSLVDPTYELIIYEGVKSRIRIDRILTGGVRFDGIPSLDQPKMIPAAKANYLSPDEPVFGISINGDSRAYPQRILDWHEMMNDMIGGVPVSLAYCTLCGSGIAYDGRASDGNTFTFGTSGLLYESNKLMYDRQTHSLWNHFTGKPVVGSMAETDIELKRLPINVGRWDDWVKEHPETVVLDLDTGFERRYKVGAAYGTYFTSSTTMFSLSTQDNRLPLKSRVYGLRIDGAAKAYPLQEITRLRVVNDVVGKTQVVVVAAHGSVDVRGTALMDDKYSEDIHYNAGGRVTAFARHNRKFRPGKDRNSLLDSDDKTWKVTNDALIGPGGETIPRIIGIQSFWFAWYSFNQDTQVYEVPGTS